MTISTANRATWIVAGSILTVGSLFWGSLNVLGLLAHEERTTVNRIDASGLSTIEIDNDDGSVRIEAADTESITITARLSEGLQTPESAYRIEGDRLILDGDCKGIDIADVWCRVSYRIEVPVELAVVVSTSDGRVTVVGTSGDVEARSSDGSVVLEELAAATVVASSGDGNVTVELATSPRSVDASSRNGNVTVVIPDEPVAFAVDADTRNGRETVEVRTDPSSDRTLRIDSRNGNVTARYGP